MNVLVACEESQAVTKEFRRLGHNAFSCDVIECSGGHPEWHIQQNVLPLLNGRCEFTTLDGVTHMISDRWDMIIAHPPCTYMSKAGARWMYPGGVLDEIRFSKAMAARSFFEKIQNADCERIAIENPVPLKIVALPQWTQKIQPYEFGEPFSKATCLWLNNLQPLKPTAILSSFKPYIPSNTGAFSKGKKGSYGASPYRSRSKTFRGIAKAMAEQWGGDINEINTMQDDTPAP